MANLVVVGIPCGVAVMSVLVGKMEKGFLAPYEERVCKPLREELEGGRIEMVEDTVAQSWRVLVHEPNSTIEMQTRHINEKTIYE